jgi:chemotaxis protein methyltransferase CheR
MTGVSAARRERFFRAGSGTWMARPELQRLVTWRVHDLLRDPVPGRFDLIVCRNVAIYFTDAAKTELYRSFADSLGPDGILFVGATESIPTAARVGLTSVAPGFYRRVT